MDLLMCACKAVYHHTVEFATKVLGADAPPAHQTGLVSTDKTGPLMKMPIGDLVTPGALRALQRSGFGGSTCEESSLDMLYPICKDLCWLGPPVMLDECFMIHGPAVFY